MEKLGNLLPEISRPIPKKDRRTERGELLKYFRNKINAGRLGTKYKPLSMGYFAMRLSYMSVPDLYHLKSICDDAQRRGGGFSKMFFWAIKPQEERKEASK
jgi:hypothetical protein